MGFVGGGVIVALQLPYPNQPLCIVLPFMKYFNLIFNACLRLRFLDVETSPGPWRPVPDVC